MNEQAKDLKIRTKAFALRVIRMYSKLPGNNAVAQVPGRQVLRSGTAVGANYREASRTRSQAEFISKTGDCLKEIDEAEYWLELIVDSGCIPAGRMAELLDEARATHRNICDHRQKSQRPKCRLQHLAFRIRPLLSTSFA